MNFCVAFLISKKIRTFLVYYALYFKIGKNAAEMQEKICAVYGEAAVTQACQKWFAKFCAPDFSLDDSPQLGRPVEVDSDQIETFI